MTDRRATSPDQGQSSPLEFPSKYHSLDALIVLSGTMDPIQRLSLYLWLLVSNLPPVPVGRLLMPSVFLTAWTVLATLNTTPALAFVWAAALAAATHLWFLLPHQTLRMKRRGGTAWTTYRILLALSVGAISAQAALADPWLTQRILTFAGLAFLFGASIGVSAPDDMVRDLSPTYKNAAVSVRFQRHIFKLKALIAVIFIATNETLLILTTPLSTRVVVLSLLPIALHYTFWILARLTCPIEDSNKT